MHAWRWPVQCTTWPDAHQVQATAASWCVVRPGLGQGRVCAWSWRRRGAGTAMWILESGTDVDRQCCGRGRRNRRRRAAGGPPGRVHRRRALPGRVQLPGAAAGGGRRLVADSGQGRACAMPWRRRGAGMAKSEEDPGECANIDQVDVVAVGGGVGAGLLLDARATLTGVALGAILSWCLTNAGYRPAGGPSRSVRCFRSAVDGKSEG